MTNPRIIDNLEAGKEVIKVNLSKLQLVTLMVEGFNITGLYPHNVKFSHILIGLPNGQSFLFDVMTCPDLGEVLRPLLEKPALIKVISSHLEVRKALWNGFKINLTSFFDCSLPLGSKVDQKYPFASICDVLGDLKNKYLDDNERITQRSWLERPLTQKILDISRENAILLHQIYLRLNDEVEEVTHDLKISDAPQKSSNLRKIPKNNPIFVEKDPELVVKEILRLGPMSLGVIGCQGSINGTSLHLIAIGIPGQTWIFNQSEGITYLTPILELEFLKILIFGQNDQIMWDPAFMFVNAENYYDLQEEAIKHAGQIKEKSLLEVCKFFYPDLEPEFEGILASKYVLDVLAGEMTLHFQLFESLREIQEKKKSENVPPPKVVPGQPPLRKPTAKKSDVDQVDHAQKSEQKSIKITESLAKSSNSQPTESALNLLKLLEKSAKKSEPQIPVKSEKLSKIDLASHQPITPKTEIIPAKKPDSAKGSGQNPVVFPVNSAMALIMPLAKIKQSDLAETVSCSAQIPQDGPKESQSTSIKPFAKNPDLLAIAKSEIPDKNTDFNTNPYIRQILSGILIKDDPGLNSLIQSFVPTKDLTPIPGYEFNWDPIPIIWADKSWQFLEFVKVLKEFKFFSLDFKVTNGEVNFIVIGSKFHIFIFDVLQAKDCMPHLRPLLENNVIKKLMFKSMVGVNALKNQFGFVPRNILDVNTLNSCKLGDILRAWEAISLAILEKVKINWRSRPLEGLALDLAPKITNLLINNCTEILLHKPKVPIPPVQNNSPKIPAKPPDIPENPAIEKSEISSRKSSQSSEVAPKNPDFNTNPYIRQIISGIILKNDPESGRLLQSFVPLKDLTPEPGFNFKSGGIPVSILKKATEFENAIQILKELKFFSLDLKVTNDAASLIVIGTKANIFIFDVNTKDNVWRLKELLENPAIKKLMFHPGLDVDILKNQYGIRIKNNYDVSTCKSMVKLTAILNEWSVIQFAILADRMIKWKSRPLKPLTLELAPKIANLLINNCTTDLVFAQDLTNNILQLQNSQQQITQAQNKVPPQEQPKKLKKEPQPSLIQQPEAQQQQVAQDEFKNAFPTNSKTELAEEILNLRLLGSIDTTKANKMLKLLDGLEVRQKEFKPEVEMAEKAVQTVFTGGIHGSNIYHDAK